MEADDIDLLIRNPVRRRRLTVEDYHRLAETGILGEDDRVELLDGQLVDMSPIGPRHAIVTDILTEMLITALAGRAVLRVQGPIGLDGRSEPEPDLSVLRRGWAGASLKHPAPSDVLLLIEVADSSLRTDRGAKRALYARAGIREFWIVDLIANLVRVHRDPNGGNYATEFDIAPTGVLEMEAVPDVTIQASALFF